MSPSCCGGGGGGGEEEEEVSMIRGGNKDTKPWVFGIGGFYWRGGDGKGGVWWLGYGWVGGESKSLKRFVLLLETRERSEVMVATWDVDCRQQIYATFCGTRCWIWFVNSYDTAKLNEIIF
jgi:hypothetical protein